MQDAFDENLHNTQEIRREFQEILNLIEKFSSEKTPPTAELPKKELTGQITDLANADGMTKNVIDNLDPNVKESLLKNLERAEKQGLIEVDFENKKIKLTEKGKEYVKNPEFQKELQIDRVKLKNANNTEIFGVELKGNDSDLLFFKNNKSMDIKAIDFSKVSPEMTEKFKKNIEKWHEEGLIKIDGSKISLTEKGANLLKSPKFTEKFGGNLTEKALSTVPQGKLFIALKQVVSAAKTATTAAKSDMLGG